MRVLPVNPAKDNTEENQRRFTEIMKAVMATESKVDGNALAQAWLGDYTRVFVSVDQEGKYNGIGIMVHGRRYYDEHDTGSVLLCRGAGRQVLLQAMADLSRVLRLHCLFYQEEPGDTLGGEAVTMRQLKLDS